MINVTFDGLQQAKQIYDPVLVEKAAYSATRKLQAKTATRVSREVRGVYAIKAGEISKALIRRVRTSGGIPSGYLIYTSKRLSLRHFTTYRSGSPSAGARPVVRTPAGSRRGVKAKVVRTRPARLIKGAFWGRGRAGFEDGAGEWQIFQRMGMSRTPLRKLTGPSIAHMVRNKGSMDSLNRFLRSEANETLSKELDHFIKRQAGIR